MPKPQPTTLTNEADDLWYRAHALTPKTESAFAGALRQVVETYYIPWAGRVIDALIERKLRERQATEAALLAQLLDDLGYLPRRVDWAKDDPAAAVNYIRAKLGLGGVDTERLK